MTFDESVRRDFPILLAKLNGKPLTYLDTASTSLKPSTVIQAESDYLSTYSANVHRGSYLLSDLASEKFESARCKVARFFGVAQRQVVFTRGATESINLVASGLDLKRDIDPVLIPTNEHHSNIVPWMRAASVIWLEQAVGKPVFLNDVVSLIERHRPKVLAISFASNVTGVVNPVESICKVARATGVITCIDASQIVLHRRVSFTDLGADYLAFSAHKMLGPTGVGVLIGTERALKALRPLTVGGGAVDLVDRYGFTLKDIPYCLEAGTPNIGGVIGLGAAVDYLSALDQDAHVRHNQMLADHIVERISNTAACVKLVGQGDVLPLGSFAVTEGLGAGHHISRMLSDYFGVMVRSGLHCAHPLFDGLHLPEGAVRISAGPYTNITDIDLFFECFDRLMHRIAA